MTTQQEAQFIVAPIGAHTWAVGCSRKLIPGAYLRSKQAALEYVSALADAAGMRSINVHIADERRKPRNMRRARPR